jgi:integrase
MRTPLTDKLLRSLRGRPATIWDQSLSGFGVRAHAGGGISFFAMARQRGDSRRPIRITIGRYPLTSLGAAREQARGLLRDLSAGIDPRARRAAELAAETVKRSNTVAAVAEDFIRRHVARARTAHTIELLIRRELIARWGDRPITDITRRDAVTMVEEIVDRGHPEAARRALTYTKRLFDWAITRGIHGLEHAPTDRLKAQDLVGAKKPRQRVLTDTEVALIWRASGELPYPDGPYIRLLLLLGQRRTELALATWDADEIDLARALWVIPAGRMKSDETHAVPLPPPAVKILRALPRSGRYVFSPRGTHPLNDFSAVKDRLDQAIVDLNGAAVRGWTLHDLRRTFRTGLSSLRIAPHVAELCIAHRQPGLAGVYDLHRFEDEKRHAMNAWASRVLSLVEPSSAKVARLK